ncbi:hypothetical protein JCM30471_26620 [Desulfuromonas carbonis]|uniref:hypothetical protein n=1 Tax=Desulfuromonas sp. DDH964 TaxID=1823759 RepID=UPI00078EDAD4|nr:hypothetical protein [Desulfuromonas sp. DDH964]AMV70854.1 hypothetical protein DBW_0453 [Desulfuromonas sp. DDH964]
MVEKIFATLEQHYQPGCVNEPVTFYFSIGAVKRTVFLQKDACRVELGRTVAEADCVCKMEENFFLKIWNDGYRPGLKDFLSGAIKSNDPQRLKLFLAAFGKGE